MGAMPTDNQIARWSVFPADSKNGLEKMAHGLTYLIIEVGVNVKHVELLVMGFISQIFVPML